MRLSVIFVSTLLLVFTIGCTGKDPVPPTEKNETTESLCLPPLTVDTSTVQMYMHLNTGFYKPIYNFNCIIYNPLLNINQLWINGSTFPALKVITLMLPEDITPGSYPLQFNSSYDARYVPSGNINFLADYGTLLITKHNMATKHIEGGFNFHATNIDAPTQPFVDITQGCFWADY